MSVIDTVFDMIAQQQKSLGVNSAPWMAGEQLKDICMREPEAAELLLQDLALPEMSLTSAEGKIKAWADKLAAAESAKRAAETAEAEHREAIERERAENERLARPRRLSTATTSAMQGNSSFLPWRTRR